MLAAAFNADRIGDIASGIIFGIGGAAVSFGLVGVLMAVPASIGHARLMSGRGVIERWHVTPREWDRFRAFDASRAAQGPTLTNDLPIRNVTPEQGVDVIVGRTQLIVDGSYHTLRPRGLPELRAVGWLNAPADPECLEFALLYPAGRYGGARLLSLRVPVPPSAREAGVRVYHHFEASVPKFRPGLAYRRPGLVFGWGIGLTLACLAVSGVGWLLAARGMAGDLPAILMVSGLVAGICPLLVTVLVALITQPWKKK
ncbi:MAG: hypothetical protein FJX20_19455 [Alphaproteobacteria bacterium]|nr:hypothetical protein [Alphaproteobacteria bacterium]